MFNRVAALPLLLIRSPLLHMVYYFKPPEQDGRVIACQFEYVPEYLDALSMALDRV